MGLKLYVLEDSHEQRQFYKTTLEPFCDINFLDNFSQIDFAAMLEQDAYLISEYYIGGQSLIYYLESKKVSFEIKERIIVVSKVAEVSTISQCLKFYCHDYFLKPVDSNLLMAKLHYYYELLSEKKYESQIMSKLSKFNLILTKKESDILSYFLKNQHQPVTRKDLLIGCWSTQNVGDKVLDVHMFNLRKKLSEIGMMIRWGQGAWTLVELPPQQNNE